MVGLWIFSFGGIGRGGQVFFKDMIEINGGILVGSCHPPVPRHLFWLFGFCVVLSLPCLVFCLLIWDRLILVGIVKVCTTKQNRNSNFLDLINERKEVSYSVLCSLMDAILFVCGLPLMCGMLTRRPWILEVCTNGED